MEISYKDLKNLIMINKSIVDNSKRYLNLKIQKGEQDSVYFKNKQIEVDILEPIINKLEKQLADYKIDVQIKR